jgi:hypothetical protein
MMIKVTCESTDRLAVEQEVDQDIAGFDKWVQGSGLGDPLSRPERAIIKTWLAYKLGISGATKKPSDG